VQIESDGIIADPISLLDVVNKRRISYTFAPNFLLTSLVKALEDDKEIKFDDQYVQNLEKLNLSEVLEYLNNKDDPEVRQAYRAPDSKHDALSFIDDDRLKPWDLSCLRTLISGGETNVVATCEKLTDMLQSYGAPFTFIRPGFGMTETCAGSVYSLNCPGGDLKHGGEYAHLGHAIKGLRFRVMPTED
jgi:acyl-CoA synthetase (AMP-forming)/AMP-acid ligase II